MTKLSNFAEKHSDYAFETVPADKRQNWIQVSVVWAGFVLVTSNLITGSVAGSALPLSKAILAILLGNVVLAIIGILQSRAGCETNLSTYVLARYALGNKGSKLMSLVFIISYVGWYGVGIGLTASVAAAYIPINEHVIAFIFAVLFMSTALFGYNGLKVLSSFAVPFVMIVSALGLYKVLGQGGGIDSLLAMTPSEPQTFSSIMFITIGTWVSGAILAPDIARYAKSKTAAYVGASVGFLFGNSSLMIVGAVLALSAGTWDLAAILTKMGFGLVGLLFLIIIQWTTSDNGLYSSGLALANIFGLKGKFWVTLGAGIVGTILATVGIYGNIIGFISFFGAVIIPLGGILIFDYLFFKSKYSTPHYELTKEFSIPAMVAWAVGIYIAKYTFWGSPAINSLLLSGVIHYGLSIMMGYHKTDTQELKKEA